MINVRRTSRRPLLLAMVSLIWMTPVGGQQQDITFFVIGKHANFNQLASGELSTVDFSFFSEIFFTSDGDAKDAFLNLPTGERLRFRDQRLADGPDRDNLLLITGAKRFSSYAELQSWYPDGVYAIEFDTPSGAVQSGTLEFPQDGLPTAPHLTLWQDGRLLDGFANPNRDVEVRWSEFAQGGTDENGILDDLIFAILEDESGQRVSHSGRPFEERSYLTYADSSHSISAAVLQAGHEYTLSVEHAVLSDTRLFDDVPAMTTYAVTTNLKFRTAADASVKTDDIPSTDAQVVMFYYSNLDAADHFYGETLGFSKTLDDDWIKFYKTGDNASVGLVAEGDGAWHRAQDNSAVMLSIVTSEVDVWYDRLQQRDGVVMLKELSDGGPIRSFLIEDPGGYTVEFFQWLPDFER